MKFEDALSEMKKGKKIRHPHFNTNEYLIACYVSLVTIIDENGKELIDSFDDAKKRGMSIVKMKGDKQHSDMTPRNYPYRQNCCNPDLHSMPQLNLFSIISEDWEIVDEF